MTVPSERVPSPVIVGRVVVRAAAGSQGAAGAGGRGRVGSKYSSLAELNEIGEANAGQCVDQVGLSGADVVCVLGAGAKGAAGCHSVIVRALLPLSPT